MRAAFDSELADLPLEEASRLLRRGKISPVELTDAALDRIALLEPEQHSFITVLKDAARRQAREAAREIARGKWRGPLHGIPVSLKDNFETRGVRTTAGSKILAKFVPSRDSAVAAKLKQAGAILLGKTNLHEFAYGVTTENPFFGSTQNPWSRDRIAGGSSGGSAAAVASGMGFASVGTDTGGSVRIPSALCGVVGLKPTFGLVSLEGCVPLAESLDHAGPIARDVAGACILLEAIAGNYPQGARRPDFRRLRALRPRRFRIGWPSEYFFERVDPEIVRAVEKAGESLESLGGRSQKISLPHLNESMAPSTVIALAEAADYHESRGWFPARAAEYSEDLRNRLQQGCELRAVEYLAAMPPAYRSGARFRRGVRARGYFDRAHHSGCRAAAGYARSAHLRTSGTGARGAAVAQSSRELYRASRDNFALRIHARGLAHRVAIDRPAIRRSAIAGHRACL